MLRMDWIPFWIKNGEPLISTTIYNYYAIRYADFGRGGDTDSRILISYPLLFGLLFVYRQKKM